MAQLHGLFRSRHRIAKHKIQFSQFLCQRHRPMSVAVCFNHSQHLCFRPEIRPHIFHISYRMIQINNGTDPLAVIRYRKHKHDTSFPDFDNYILCLTNFYITSICKYKYPHLTNPHFNFFKMISYLFILLFISF